MLPVCTWNLTLLLASHILLLRNTSNHYWFQGTLSASAEGGGSSVSLFGEEEKLVPSGLCHCSNFTTVGDGNANRFVVTSIQLPLLLYKCQCFKIYYKETYGLLFLSLSSFQAWLEATAKKH